MSLKISAGGAANTQPQKSSDLSTTTTSPQQQQPEKKSGWAPKPGQYAMSFDEVARELATKRRDMSEEKYEYKGEVVTVSRKHDSTHRASKALMAALLDPAKARELLEKGIPEEGIAPPKPRTKAEYEAAVKAEAALQAAAVARGEHREPQPIKPCLYDVLNKVAQGKPITKERLDEAVSVVASWTRGNRSVLDGFYASMLAEAKKQQRQW